MSRSAVAAAVVTWLALWATHPMPAAGGEHPPRIDLAKGWKAKQADEAGGLAAAFIQPAFDDSSWEAADVPAGEPPYQARFILYRRWVEAPAAWKGKPVSLAFGAVDDDAVVYLNGQRLGEHQGWDEEFAFDVAQRLRFGQKNLVAVLADNSGGGPGGMWRSVALVLTEEVGRARAEAQAKLREELKALPYRIVFETLRDGNWDLCSIRPDGSDPVNLTRTPDAHELYPHVSPEGAKVCFVADEGQGEAKIRNVYVMDLDGTGRTLVARNARQPCWSPDGTAIAYLKGEFDKFSYRDYATKGIFVYDLATREHRQHPRKDIHHLYNLCWSPDGGSPPKGGLLGSSPAAGKLPPPGPGGWFLATIHAGMGFKHAILAIEASGTQIHDLKIPGCRPDASPDGRHVAWGASDWALRIGDLDFSRETPRVVNPRDVVTSKKPTKIYHIDWSPDGRYVAFSRGPSRKRLGHAPEIVGIPAEGWDICVADAHARNRWLAITTDGLCNKEPDWAPLPKAAP